MKRRFPRKRPSWRFITQQPDISSHKYVNRQKIYNDVENHIKHEHNITFEGQANASKYKYVLKFFLKVSQR